MPTVTFDGQSFSVRGRRIWLSAVEFDYALVPQEAWPSRLAAAAHAGFNTVVANCPWALHEERPGRFRFDGALDVARLAALCAELNLWLVLRIGPSVGATYDGGGLPAWLSGLAGIRVREPNPIFFERVTKWYRAIAERVISLQATERSAARESGPIVAVQLEDNWSCGVTERANAYFAELVRFAREVGFEVPLLTANQSWTAIDAATDTWAGWDDISATVRQLGFIEPGKPRIVTVRDPASDNLLGQDAGARGDGEEHLVRIARALAAGGQAIVGDAFTLTHRGVTAGRSDRGFFAATARTGSMFDATGDPVAGCAVMRRATSFASSFGHVLAQVDVSQRSIVVEPERSAGVAVVPLSGAGGTAIFVFNGDPRAKKREHLTVPLLLRDGRRLDAIASGAVSWFLVDVELFGAGVLDHSTISPVAFLDRRYLVFIGPAGAEANISIDGTPITVQVPPRAVTAKPAIERRKNLIAVICNDDQWEGLRLEDGGLVCEVGSKTHRIARDGTATTGATRRNSVIAATTTVPMSSVVSAHEYIDGSSERFATIDGPATLAACGARDGCGWYRIGFRRTAADTATLFAPGLADRATVWLDGAIVGTVGAGPSASEMPFRVKPSAGEHRMVLFVEQLGRPTIGDSLARRTGFFGPLFDVQELRATPKRERGVAANPFALRGFISGIAQADVNAGEALTWKLKLKAKSSLLLASSALTLAATVLVDGKPFARIASDGTEDRAIVIDPAAMQSAAGLAIAVVFDGDPDESAIAQAAESIRFFEATGAVGSSFAFARFAPPTKWTSAKSTKGAPAWSRGVAALPEPKSDLWLDVSGFVDGLAYLNERALGRFARSATASAPPLHVPKEFLRKGDNEVVIFDVTGATAKSVVLSSRTDAKSS